MKQIFLLKKIFLLKNYGDLQQDRFDPKSNWINKQLQNQVRWKLFYSTLEIRYLPVLLFQLFVFMWILNISHLYTLMHYIWKRMQTWWLCNLCNGNAIKSNKHTSLVSESVLCCNTCLQLDSWKSFLHS